MLTLQYASGWRNLGVPRVNTYTLARRGEEVLAHLGQRGVRLPPGNRVQLAIRTIDRLNANSLVPSEDDPSTCRETGEALRTLWEAFFIMHAALDRKWQRDPFPNELLRYMLKGAPIAQGESNPDARAKEFELYVAAMFAAARADVQAGEPDLRFLYHGEYLGVAAKRVRSVEIDTLVKDMRDGGDQIARQGLRGFLALNLDAYLDSLDITVAGEALGASFNRSVEAAHGELLRLTYRPIIGVMILGNRVEWVFDEAKPSIRWTSPTQVLGFSELEPEERFREYFDTHFTPRLEAGLSRVAALVA